MNNERLSYDRFMAGDYEEWKKLSRPDHPPTSQLAAEAIVEQLPRLHAYVLGAVTMHPGSTVNELSEEYRERDPRRIGRRLVELERMGFIRRGDPRRCKITGKLAATWVRREP